VNSSGPVIWPKASAWPSRGTGWPAHANGMVRARCVHRRWCSGCQRLGRRGVGRSAGRAPWVHDECAGQGERQRDSPSKQVGNEAMEMGSGGGVSGDGGVLSGRRR
jgi:hypothetical protein